MVEPDDLEDARSSSLSDIDDRMDDDQARTVTLITGSLISEHDSEAETERLENSPEKSKRHANAVVGAVIDYFDAKDIRRLSDKMKSHDAESERNGSPLPTGRNGAPRFFDGGEDAPMEDAPPDAKAVVQTRNGSSKVPSPPEIAGQKRKRTDVDGADRGSTSSEDAEANEPLRKRKGSVRAEAASEKVKLEENGANEAPIGEGAPEYVEDRDENRTDAEGLKGPKEGRSRTTRATRKGRRKTARQAAMDETDAVGNVDGNDSHDDDRSRPADAEDAGEGDEDEDADAAARNEEGLLRKHDAMGSLGGIEGQFAAFRDKLYDERLAQLSNEYVSLTSPHSSHPDYVAKLQCVDARRDRKIHLEQVLYQYKLKALQTKFMAMRSQIHSQYYQTARDVREQKLEEVGERLYKMQRDRRQWEGIVPDCAFMFPKDRTRQIATQTAYNREVSLLAGIAKYAGFPGAPEIASLSAQDITADLQAMGL